MILQLGLVLLNMTPALGCISDQARLRLRLLQPYTQLLHNFRNQCRTTKNHT
ncbi:hypothetical protein PF005_g27755 [Phytophthora fragariae]|uniref:Uncharacterized protein n=1 Tax=Phytophthora fragariae TaxID=53985 RepID=A0A6A3WB17_9STRA|nr:hypothetical protein PF003_g14774 [Phytophthora fragariae]KAE8941293.1 hypothetical protein PF009_g8915 [Phytophthora fragariae]KAE8971209.1 hypothetical protein PF011_g26116 [Phytophthora fragariae]KAE9068568.1 hypothetical protein PF010_g27014 [Phytophthora fragariae]KAE9069973.1 hypothetical protein PF007_g27111 [Phytophthora fragariae]